MADISIAGDDRIGLICGGGTFPLMVARGARGRGHHVVAVGIRGLADAQLADVVDEFYWTGILRVGQWIRLLRRSRCNRVILAGAVRKSAMYDRRMVLSYRPDWTTLGVWFGLRDYRSDTVLNAVANELTRQGLLVEDCVMYTRDNLAREGCMTVRKPNAAQHNDVRFGWRVARALGRYDIGQAVAIKEQDVIAVEAVEGTDGMIERVGELCRSGGWSLVKVTKPQQDLRFDVPTVGPETIHKLHAHGGRLLCVEAGRTVMVDQEEMLRLADQFGIVVMALKAGADEDC
jgi:hypothetical protein